MDFTLIRSRRKTLSIEITPRGDVLVRAPHRLSNRDIQQFLESRQEWISTHLAKLSQTAKAVPLTAEEHRALIRSAKALIPQRVAFYADRLGVTYGRITIRSQHTRWGSCSSTGNLNFNCLLMLSPAEVLDYVIVHELCHRKEMNHSPRFWAEVESILPDYRSRRQWLKEQGRTLLTRLP